MMHEPGKKRIEPEYVDIYALEDMQRFQKQMRADPWSIEGFNVNDWCQPNAQRRELSYATHQQVFNCRALVGEFPNLREFFEIVSGAVTLCYRTGMPIKLPRLLLNGPPGCGKTLAINRLADALELPLYTIYMTNLHGRFELVGGHRAYKSAEPGLLTKLLLESPCANPLVLFDEAENGAPDLYGPLYSFLEDQHFQDHYLQLSLTTGYVNNILLTNQKEKLTPAIRSRVRELQVAAPTRDTMIVIIQRIYRDLQSRYPMYQRFVETLTDEVVNKLVPLPLRQVRLCLENAMCKAAYSRWQATELSIVVDDLPDVDSPETTSRPPGFTAW